MYIYKYLELGACKKNERFEEILTTGSFWHSKFHKFNDPMEGIYYTHNDKKYIDLLANEKNKYLIGAFAGNGSNKVLWAYYSGGFSGVCIKIRVDEIFLNQIYKMRYVSEENFLNPLDGDLSATNLLTRKLSFWRNEAEYRILHYNEKCDGIGNY